MVCHLAALIAIPYSYQAPGRISRPTRRARSIFSRPPVPLGLRGSSPLQRARSTAALSPFPWMRGHPLHAQSPYSASKIAADKFRGELPSEFRPPHGHTAALQHLRSSPIGARRDFDGDQPTGQRTARVSLGSLTPTRDFTFVREHGRGLSRSARGSARAGRRSAPSTRDQAVRIAVGDLAQLIAKLMARPSLCTAKTSVAAPSTLRSIDWCRTPLR